MWLLFTQREWMKNNVPTITSDHLDFVDDKTAALLLNTPKSARIMLWVIVLFFLLLLSYGHQWHNSIR